MVVDDDLLTLEAALAFIDSNYDTSRDVDTFENHEIDVAGTNCPLVVSKEAKKRARNVASAAHSNRKKRAELLALREQVVVLETKKEMLMARRAGTGSSERPRVEKESGLDESIVQTAMDEATAEALRLNDSQSLNHRLRLAVEQRRDIGAALVKVLQQRFDMKYVQALLREARCVTSFTSPPIVRDHRSLEVELNARLKAFSIEVDPIVSISRQDAIAESRTRAYVHPTLGRVFEMVSSAHIPCKINDGWTYIVSMYHTGVPSASPSAVNYISRLRPHENLGVIEKNFSMEFQNGQDYHRVPVQGLAVLELVESTKSKLLMWTSVVAIREDGTRVCERGWLGLTQSNGDKCVLHNRYEVYTEHTSTKACGGQEVCPKSKFLMESLLQKKRQDHHNIAYAMTGRFGSHVTCATYAPLEALCLLDASLPSDIEQIPH